MPKQSFKQHFLKPTRSISAHSNRDERRKAVERDLINAESALGRSLFGEVRQGHTREFFCLKKNVWLWYEDGLMIRYEVRENGVYKQVGQNADYQRVTGEELQNFRNATKTYLKLIKTRIYSH